MTTRIIKDFRGKQHEPSGPSNLVIEWDDGKETDRDRVRREGKPPSKAPGIREVKASDLFSRDRN